MKKILTAIDFSDVTNRVLEKTVELAKMCGAEVRVLHTEQPEIDYMGYGGYMPYCNMAASPLPGPQVQSGEATKLAGNRSLAEIRERLAGDGVEAECVELEGPTAELILAEAETFGADLLIIGTHEHSLFYYLLVGSTRDSVLRRAKCPVLVIPAEH